MKKGSLFLATSFRVSYMRLFGFCFLYFSLVAGTHAACPLQLNPQRVVLDFGGSVSADCNTSIPHDGMGWEASEGAVPMSEDSVITWRVSNLREWNIQPSCFINPKDPQIPQCLLNLTVILYKTPDSVSISSVNHNGPMMEGNQYELQCDVLNVAPVQYLTVKWYKGNTLVNQTNFNETIKTPVSKTSKLLIRPDRDDDEAQYRCEAELELGEEGPQPPPKVTSDPLNIIVHSKPIINETKLPSEVTVFRGHTKVLVCEAEGNPKPTISWNLSPNDPVYGETLTITDSTPENVYCNASNSVNSTTRHVKVSIQVNYVPIIVGIIVAVVLVISVICIFIYFSLYKKTRMGHYNFRKPKANNGLLAQPAQPAEQAQFP